ncbi:MAG: hypothetical protein GDA37_10590 [Ekhidna sp.]|nr:hypothetical protein [Ekhidna sp.]
MALDSKKAYKNLKKKGFEDSKNHSNDHKYLEFHHNGKMILYIKLSHGSKKDLNDNLIKKMSVQCKLSKQDFINLGNCPLSTEEYIEKLKEIGEIK